MKYYLGGGFKHFFHLPLGKWSNLTTVIFFNWVETTTYIVIIWPDVMIPWITHFAFFRKKNTRNTHQLQQLEPPVPTATEVLRDLGFGCGGVGDQSCEHINGQFRKSPPIVGWNLSYGNFLKFFGPIFGENQVCDAKCIVSLGENPLRNSEQNAISLVKFRKTFPTPSTSPKAKFLCLERISGLLWQAVIFQVVVWNIFCFHPYLGKWSNLTI